ncbi:MAG TPA: DUF397 domain-containing protein [Pseudonocardiaceae bacterium]|jgi:hypothetical protein|nr:DUF397 domain-containing protein [Pseudonocardiaceae bacterium]
MRTTPRTLPPSWRKSTYSSGEENSDCVEVAVTSQLIAVRDSKNTDAAPLTFPVPTWQAFLSHSHTR